MEIQETKTNKSPIKEWAITIAIFVGVFIFLRTFIGVPVITNGESMSPTLVHGDTIFVNKFAYTFSDPEFGDIIVFPFPADPSREFIKRVIGVPGDTIDFVESDFYINDKLFDDPFAITDEPVGDTTFPIVLGEDEYFVLGDNRAVSHDSRHADVGLIEKDNIVGKASFIFYPLNRIKILKTS